LGPAAPGAADDGALGRAVGGERRPTGGRLGPVRLGSAAQPRRAALPAPAAGPLSRDGGRTRAPATAARLVAVVYAALLAAVTLLPTRWRSDLARWPDNWRPQLVPLWTLVAGIADGDRRLATLAGAVGNVLLFVPLGFLVPLVLPRLDRRWRVLTVGAGVSLLVELAQLPMPGVRRADVNDLLMNVAGTALGFFLYALASRADSRR
jgi:glycopeptide antibiotics resistance protein